MASAIERRLKRRKLHHDDDENIRPSINVKTADDLEQHLRFRKDSLSDSKTGIRAFKDFLTSVSGEEDATKQAAGLKILKEYCDAQRSPEKYSPSFPDLISTWSFAAETKNDSLLSAVPAVLAQFLKLVSRYLEFRDFGLSLCESLLYRDQVRLLERGLNAPTTKPHLISPCLRLLTELVSFDGGAFASEVFLRRETLFKRLDTLLNETYSKSNNESGDRSGPTVRRNAQRFVLANLAFQDGEVKSELILQGRVLQTFLRDLEHDADDIVQDVLQAVERHVLNDATIPRNLKSRFLNPATLASLLKLYGYNHDSEKDVLIVRERVHQILIAICTDPAKGLLIPHSGWYPAGFNLNMMIEGKTHDGIDLGLDSPEYFDDYSQSVPVRNGHLSTFAKTLTPEQDTLQAQLLLKIFQAAPELVADYFTIKTKFKSPPKEEPEWLGEFAFLFSVVQLPLPKFDHGSGGLPIMPPPTSIVIESILPRPFAHQSALTKCINLNQDILTLSSARVITVAVEKLAEIISWYHSARSNKTLWSQAVLKVKEAFLQRCPSVQNIAAAATRVPKRNDQLRGTMIQCLAVFLTQFPEQSGSVKFDVSKYLKEVMQSLQENEKPDETKRSISQQLLDLLLLAELLPEIRWWQPIESGDLSYFSLLLKTITSGVLDPSIQLKAKKIAQELLVEKGILQSHQSFTALQTSLASTKKWSPQSETFAFLDNCMRRLVQKPVRYLDILEQAQQVNSDKNPLSLIACCVSEQWQFMITKDKKSQQNVATWIARLFALLDSIGENYRVMIQLQEEMFKSCDEKAEGILQKAFNKQMKKAVDLIPASDSDDAIQPTSQIPNDIPAQPVLDLNIVFGPIPSTPDSISGLDKWDVSSLDSSISSARFSRMCHCTVSPSEELRRSAVFTLQTFLQTISTSTDPCKTQLQLVLGEFLETVKFHAGLYKPLPSVVPELAALLARIIHDPTDRMYSKANRFLLKSPRWDLSKIITYWTSKILLLEPEHDDGHNLEVDRFLQLLLNGLRTPEDLEVYRRAGVWERICALVFSPRSTDGARRRVWSILWRAMQIPGGKGMLVRRAGVGCWLGIVKTRIAGGADHLGGSASINTEESRIVDALIREIELPANGDEDVTAWQERLPMFNKKMEGEQENGDIDNHVNVDAETSSDSESES